MRAGKITLLVLLLTLTACGQTGALYFDEAPPADQMPPSLKQGSASPLPVGAPVEAPSGATAPVPGTEPEQKKVAPEGAPTP